MKKMLIAVAGLMVIVIVGGCTSAGVMAPGGYGCIIGPVVYSSATFPSAMQSPTAVNRKYKVLGNASGASSTSSLFFMFGFGNGGLEAAFQDALLKYRNADDLIDVRVDTHATNVFWMYTSATTEVYGKAIKYTDNGEVQ